MRNTVRCAALAGLLAVLLAGLSTPTELKAASIKDFGEVRINGPHTHRNLSLYILLLRDNPGRRPDYITLTEGLRTGVVTIREADNARVGRLLISNNASSRLFLQVGQVLKGGKQDRTLQVSFVVPAKTIDVPIPSFCVEQSRWSGRKGFDSGGLIVPARVRSAIQAGSQDRVWGEVAQYKRQARSAIASSSGGRVAPSRTSSVHEELSHGRLRKLCSDYESALAGTAPRDFPRP